MLISLLAGSRIVPVKMILMELVEKSRRATHSPEKEINPIILCFFFIINTTSKHKTFTTTFINLLEKNLKHFS